MTLLPGPHAEDGPRPKLLLCGLDSLYVSYYLNLRRSQIDFEELAFQKELLKETRRRDFGEVRLGTERFALMPYLGEHVEVRIGEAVILGPLMDDVLELLKAKQANEG